MRRRAARLPVPLLAALLIGSCSTEPPTPRGPESIARELFEIAAADEPADSRLLELFGVDAEDSRRAALLDALSELPAADDLTVSGVEPLEPAGVVVVDLTVRLGGGAEAGYAVQLRPRDDGAEGWTVRWFGGPGVEWPAAGGRGQGLTTSAPPG